MLLGALVGFVAGAAVGMGSADLAHPILAPLVGATAGVALAWLPLWRVDARGRRRAHRELERAHERFRVEAHRGWVDGVDLSSVPRPPISARRAGGPSLPRPPRR